MSFSKGLHKYTKRSKGMAILRGFKGGVHPPYMKLTADKPIRKAGIPEVLYVPLQQHAGAPASPLVKRGDKVLAGQKIGEINGFISANIHAPTSGKVKNILDHPHPVAGRSTPAVIIEADGEDSWVELKEREDYLNTAPSDIVEIVREAGIVGMGGAAFPTHVKLSPPADKPIEFVIINGAECEPYLTADDRLMREYADEIADGSYLVLKAVNARRGFVGIENNKPEAIKEMRRAFKKFPQFEVVELPTKYPQGSEKHLIKAILGREVPSGGLPMDVGVVVQNVGTARAIYQAVRFGRPLIERVTTLTGDAVAGPGNYMVRIGTPFRSLIEEGGGFKEDPAKVINGGPMMGIAQYSLDVPVIKGTSGIVVFSAKNVVLTQEGPCIRCGRCLDVCPMFLMPTTMAKLIKAGRFDDARKIGLFDCIECGSCSYVCPSNIPLVQYFKYGKAELRLRR